MLALSLLTIDVATAQEYPTKPITIVVPFGAGGTTDIAARLIASHLTDALGTRVLVDNRPGASTMVGAEHVAKAPADGYTLLMAAASTFSTNPHLYRKIKYRLEDFDPVSLVSKVPFVLNVSSQIPARTIDEFVAWAKMQPQGVTYATTGVGTSNHITGILVANALGIRMVDVPYKTNAAANVDLIGGRVHAQLDALASAQPLHVEGKTRILGVLDSQRWQGMPDIPTFVEKGYKAEGASWFALMAPAGTPALVMRKLSGALSKVMAMEDVKAKLLAGGQLPVSMSADATLQFIKADHERWGAVINGAGIQLD
ncbi:Bug family tripartite tricarboxylate transporter substrate binding protein [Hydrogenophaga sp. BPS33]|uniref:Bug family tripartite tricarboxylate transporter substrate binding protein n=1 Tax=Hydrogenophaga sp. BPS33 TaxID=2651974 RepID=UPI00135A1E06|nr:tripartite tricarboxylate transporter substrate binding protein [Hydrogenophaga sp. BPS33]